MSNIKQNGVEVSAETLTDLSQKIDTLSDQVAFLIEEARQQRRQRQEWEELKADLTPIATDAFQLSIQQLDEIEQYVQAEDILHLFKRLLRNTRNLEGMLDQIESLTELGGDIAPLTRTAFMTMMTRLDEMERKGYFMFLRGGMDIFDQIADSFNEEDVSQLSQNVVLILNTIKEMTQPEIMQFMRRTVAIANDTELPSDVSLLGIIRQLNDPAVKRGLSKTLTVLKSVSEPSSKK